MRKLSASYFEGQSLQIKMLYISRSSRMDGQMHEAIHVVSNVIPFNDS